MSGRTTRISLLFVLACSLAVTSTANAQKGLTASQARRVFTRVPGFEIKSSAVRVKSVTPDNPALLEITADIQLVFKFETDKAGQWRVAEIRSGQDRWEHIDLIARALKASIAADDCNAPDAPLQGKLAVDPSVRRARCLLGSLFGIEVPSDALRIQTIAPMPVPMATQPSATVVAWIRMDARLTQSGKGWQVAELRTGKREWVNLEPLFAALDLEKQNRARAELQMMAAALEKFRSERGFYVVGDKHATAIDYLSPRYLPRVIRIDPWQQPYLYLGQRDHFTLRSSGPDRKPDTPDDIAIQSK
jgi:hypothetical protein